MGGATDSSSRLHDAFGGMSAGSAQRYNRQFAGPSSQAFGWATKPGWEQALANKVAQGNPFAQYLQTTRGLFAPMQADAARAGQEIATRAPGAFQTFMDQAQGYLNQIPGFQQQVSTAQGNMGRAVGAVNLPGAQHGVDVASQMLDESRSPVQAQALYQNALRQTLQQSQQGAAGRGLLDSGSQQGREDALTRDLAAQSAASQFGQQQQALGGYQGALGTQGQLAGLLGQLSGGQGQLAELGAQLAQSGIPVSQLMMQALPAYGQLLQSGTQLPFQTAQQLQGFFGASQNPTLALLQATAPQLGQESKGWNFL